MRKFIFAILALSVAVGSVSCSNTSYGDFTGSDKGDLCYESSDSALVRTFEWAKAMAMSYVHDGSDPVGLWYEAALPERYAFCMRDVSHQSIGAEILGLSGHNFNMMSKFASNVSGSKDWCTYWEIDKWNNPCESDYASDDDFWYNLNANFDVMNACWRLYEWTGDRRYLENEDFRNFYRLSSNEYVESWQLAPEQILTRNREINVRKNAKKFIGVRGIPSYVESVGDMFSSADLIGTIYGGFDAYAKMLACTGEESMSQVMAEKAEAYRRHLDEHWWSDDINAYHTFWWEDGTFSDSEGLTHVIWFNAAKEPARIKGTVEMMLARKDWNIENVSYFPLLWYRYGYRDEAYDILDDIHQAHRCEYPEVSFGMLEGIVSGTMGIAPSASSGRVTTLPQISGDNWMQIRNIPVFSGRISVRHSDNCTSALMNNTGSTITWEAAFLGDFDTITVNGKRTKSLRRTDMMGNPVSYAEVQLADGEKAICSAK